MHYFPYLKGLSIRSSVTIYNYIMIMQGKDYVILSFILKCSPILKTKTTKTF